MIKGFYSGRFLRISSLLISAIVIYRIVINCFFLPDPGSIEYYSYLTSAVPDFKNLDGKEKCRAYFKYLDKISPQWKIEDHYVINDNTRMSMNDEVRHLRTFYNCYLKDVSKDWEDAKSEIQNGEPVKGETKAIYLLDNLYHLKNFVLGGGKSLLDDDITCPSLHGKMFPYFSNKIPVFTRWDGQKFGEIPNFRSIYPTNIDKTDLDNIDYDTVFDYSPEITQHDSCLMSYYKRNLEGKGIVITTNGVYAQKAIALIKVLRTLGNELPIQIVHSGLTKKKYSQLIHAARDPIDKINIPDTAFDSLNGEQKIKVKNFPKQELWFVNIQGCFAPDIELKGYAMKIFAYIFTTFEDVILLDADTVPFVPMERFFNMKQYKESQALFFQDRTDLKFNNPDDIQFFKDLMPNELDQSLMDHTPVTDHTLKNRFLNENFYYFMEAGLIAINKKRHYGGVLMSLQLTYWNKAIKEMLWGDKELYWLALSIMGDEDYQFNSHGAVSVGEVSQPQQHLYSTSGSAEVCSTHPGQISDNDDHSLLWINSGFETCKDARNIGWDRKQTKYKDMSRSELRKYYKSPLKIKAALLPAKTLGEFANDKGYPERGWLQTHFCYGYLWCAYDKISAFDEPKFRGKLIEYSEEEVGWFDFLGAVWMSDKNMS
ncbi:hypothetical protein DASC09_012270 [Saccharomycopsis crataegensis]|uniref:Alpha-1,3-mannosyltransferase n=1 Tax=Saccharomycopsis crataegensis TaxID=43959 RepID=A0AAV5QH30_9ASCO|nr:hypothetical protein DASC09_012270 [Saccharomycopsis crataegensis]